MAKKIISSHGSARRHLLKGVNTLADAVQVTLGPRGKNVILEKSFGSPVITKDGVSVAKEIELVNKFENMGAQMVKEVARKTSEMAGDGTTSATVLARAIYREGQKLVVAGANPMALKRGIDKGITAIIAELRRISTPVKDKTQIAHIGTVSANNDTTIGNLISEAVEKVGKDGVITVEEAKGVETYMESVEGTRFDRGYLSPYFVTNSQKMEVVLENPYILLYEKKISKLITILPLLEELAKKKQPILIICEDMEGDALASLAVNKLRGILKVAAVKAPGFGDRRKAMMEDIGVLCGGNVVFEETGIKLENIKTDELGKCKTIIIDKDNTTLIGGAGNKEAIDARMRQIRTQIEETTSDYDREKLQERLGKLSGGVAIIHVGAPTETEMNEKKTRVENALHATLAAQAEGIVPGGGVALVRCQKALEKVSVSGDEKMGVDLLNRVLSEPLRQIAENAGHEGVVVLKKVLEGQNDFGFNVEKEQYENLFAAGVIDPTKVVRLALQNAASVGGLMITTEVLISDKPQKNSLSSPYTSLDDDVY